MNFRNILVVVVILLFAFGGVAEVSSARTLSTVQSVSTVTVTTTVLQCNSTQPATLSGGQYDVVINYTDKYSNQISFNTPKSGYTYLILTLYIQNNVDTEFITNPLYFFVTINNIKYEVGFAAYALPDTLATARLFKGGIMTGSIAFQVPKGTVNYTPSYEAFEPVNVGWVHN